MIISDIYELRTHLQTAIEIEWSTIPPYLCAQWSLADGTNDVAANCVEEVVMEEMLHLTLACNLLNAIGGEPHLIPPTAQLPSYPGYLPHSDDSFLVNLMPFSREALETFRSIEKPAAVGAPPEPDKFHTIAQFYEAVGEALDRLARQSNIFTGAAGLQVGPEYYYGGGGEAFAIDSLEKANEALEVIIFQGEGIHGTIWDDDDVFGQQDELAHYFRFDELYQGRRYIKGDKPGAPTGDPILLDYASVLPMRPNPKAGDYPLGSELRALTDECNTTYSRLLLQLEAAFSGSPGQLVDSVQTMLELRYQAIALMRVPLGDGSGKTAGPAFEWRAPSGE